MNRTLIAISLVLSAQSSMALSLDDFKAVHKAEVIHDSTNSVHLKLPSAEWGSGIKWESPHGIDMSQAKWLAVDVENLSQTRQGRLTMHVSAGSASGDSGDHATAIFRKNRSSDSTLARRGR